jgi:hypothetical protein
MPGVGNFVSVLDITPEHKIVNCLVVRRAKGGIRDWKGGFTAAFFVGEGRCFP